MLVAVCLSEPRRRFLSRRRRPPEVRAEFVGAGSGRYVKITADVGRDGQPDWTAVRRAAGREAGRLLLPQGFVPPVQARVGTFDGIALARKMVEKAGVALLKAVSMHPRLVQIGVDDPQGSCPDLPLAFLPYAADVRVATRRPDRYARQRYLAMELYGATLSVTAEPGSLSGSLLLLAPDGPSEGMERVAGRGLVLSAVPAQGKAVVDGYIPRAPRGVLEANPPGCDPQRFLAGLYELSGVREIAAGPPEFLRMGAHILTLRDAAWRLAGLDIGITV